MGPSQLEFNIWRTSDVGHWLPTVGDTRLADGSPSSHAGHSDVSIAVAAPLSGDRSPRQGAWLWLPHGSKLLPVTLDGGKRWSRALQRLN